MKLLKFYLLNRIVKDTNLTAQIYYMIYRKGTPPVKSEPTIHIYTKTDSKLVSEDKVVIKNDRKETLTSALAELKSRAFKTKQDKDSIQILEAVIKNER